MPRSSELVRHFPFTCSPIGSIPGDNTFPSRDIQWFRTFWRCQRRRTMTRLVVGGIGMEKGGTKELSPNARNPVRYAALWLCELAVNFIGRSRDRPQMLSNFRWRSYWRIMHARKVCLKPALCRPALRKAFYCTSSLSFLRPRVFIAQSLRS